MDTTTMKKIEFINIDSEKLKTEIFGIIEEGLRLNGDFGVYGDLSIEIEVLLQENYMTVTNNKLSLNISIAPDSQSGHDFSFTINKSSLEINDLIVGEVIPPQE